MRGAQIGEQYRRLARQFQCVAAGDAERKHRDARRRTLAATMAVAFPADAASR